MDFLAKVLRPVAAAAALTAVSMFACDSPRTAAGDAVAVALTTAQDSTLYAVGLGLAGQFSLRGLFTEEEVGILAQGLRDGVIGEERLALESRLEQVNQLVEARRGERSARLRDEAKAFVAAAGQETGAVTTESGLVYVETRAGTGRSPVVTDSVLVHYTGRFTDGTVFDSSTRRGAPASFRLGHVIKGWQEGLQMMKEGGQARLVIPPQLGYGERGNRAIPSNVALVFEVELLKVY